MTTNFEELRQILLKELQSNRKVSYLSGRYNRPVPEQFDHTRCARFDDELSPMTARGISFATQRPRGHELQPVSFEVQRATHILMDEINAGLTDKERMLGLLQILGESWGFDVLGFLGEALWCWGARLDDMIDPTTGHVHADLYERMCAAIAAQEHPKELR